MTPDELRDYIAVLSAEIAQHQADIDEGRKDGLNPDLLDALQKNTDEARDTLAAARTVLKQLP